MIIITEKPEGYFNIITINHQSLERFHQALKAGIGASAGACFYPDALELESKSGTGYDFQFLPEAGADGKTVATIKGTVFIIPKRS